MPNDNELYAAIDLGSNSFHLLIARIIDDQLHVIDRHKDMVRLADGLQEDGSLSEEKISAALNSLQKISQRIKNIPLSHIRIVGTNTLRKAKNSKKFIKQAIDITGKPIEIISGREEARILYLGVAHSLASEHGQRLVMDIGGGSTELIIGKDFSSDLRESLHMGCVSYTKKYFPKGIISKNNWKKAVLNAQRQLQSIKKPYKKEGWEIAIGASGTMRATAQVLLQNQYSSKDMDKKGLKALIEQIHCYSHIDELKNLVGLSRRRQPVFIGGLAIIWALFQSLNLKSIQVSNGALREGIVYDLSGRLHHNDIRERTIIKLSKQFEVDDNQVARVRNICNQLVKKSAIKLKPAQKTLLQWSISLHEIGLSISHSHFEYHAAYILTHADMPGFSRQEQLKLATLIALQRRKIKKPWLEKLNDFQFKKLQPLIIILRLSVLLNRSREELDIKDISIEITETELSLKIPNSWTLQNPLTYADLLNEHKYLKNLQTKLEIKVLS